MSRSAEYRAYIRSPEWREVKRRYRASKLPQACVVCDEKKVDLHHRSYKRFGNERLTDLVPLCRPHHQQAHDWVRAGPGRSLWNASRILRRRYLT